MTIEFFFAFIFGILFTTFISNTGNDIYSYVKNKLISYFVKSKCTNSKLKNETIILHKDIMNFLKERNTDQPQTDFDNWKESTNNYLKYSSNTMNLYNEKFGWRVTVIRQEYIIRGIQNKNLDQYYTHATNPLGIEAIAYGLVDLVGKLNTTE